MAGLLHTDNFTGCAEMSRWLVPSAAVRHRPEARWTALLVGTNLVALCYRPSGQLMWSGVEAVVSAGSVFASWEVGVSACSSARKS
jgi:hypothetical protein